MASEERLRELEEKYEGYTVYDNAGSKIGKVDDLFVDERDNEEYIGVKMGFFGTKSTLIPTEIIRINESDRTIEVSESKNHVKDAPNFGDDDDVTREYEERIRSHFGLESLGSRSERGGYSGHSEGGAGGATAGGASAGAASTASDHDREGGPSGHDDTRSSPEVDTEYGERRDPGAASSAGEPTSGTGGYTEERESSGGTGSAGTTSGAAGVSSSEDSSSGSKPSTTRQTEETETFQEGGRTKIRRRIIREEVVDADDQGTS